MRFPILLSVPVYLSAALVLGGCSQLAQPSAPVAAPDSTQATRPPSLSLDEADAFVARFIRLVKADVDPAVYAEVLGRPIFDVPATSLSPADARLQRLHRVMWAWIRFVQAKIGDPVRPPSDARWQLPAGLGPVPDELAKELMLADERLGRVFAARKLQAAALANEVATKTRLAVETATRSDEVAALLAELRSKITERSFGEATQLLTRWQERLAALAIGQNLANNYFLYADFCPRSVLLRTRDFPRATAAPAEQPVRFDPPRSLEDLPALVASINRKDAEAPPVFPFEALHRAYRDLGAAYDYLLKGNPMPAFRVWKERDRLPAGFEAPYYILCERLLVRALLVYLEASDGIAAKPDERASDLLNRIAPHAVATRDARLLANTFEAMRWLPVHTTFATEFSHHLAAFRLYGMALRFESQGRIGSALAAYHEALVEVSPLLPYAEIGRRIERLTATHPAEAQAYANNRENETIRIRRSDENPFVRANRSGSDRYAPPVWRIEMPAGDDWNPPPFPRPQPLPLPPASP